MSSLSRNQLRQLSAARRRPPFELKGTLPEELVEDLLCFWRANSAKNILSDMMDQRTSLGLPLENAAYLSQDYSQIALQELSEGEDPGCPENYNIPVDEALVKAIEKTAGPICKARLSGLMPGGQISEHIDDPTQTRSLALIEGDHEFWVRSGEGYDRVPMGVGELWFVNTAWTHKVVNRFSALRVALMINHL